jgi:hypothetical protein
MGRLAGYRDDQRGGRYGVVAARRPAPTTPFVRPPVLGWASRIKSSICEAFGSERPVSASLVGAYLWKRTLMPDPRV